MALAVPVWLLVLSPFQELFYRGWMQPRLQRTLGRWPGLLATSLAFTLWHFFPDFAGSATATLPLTSLLGIASTFMAGVLGENPQRDADSAAYIRARGDRYPGGTGVEPGWTQEVMSDVDLLVFEPDPKSRKGASRFIGWSPSAGRCWWSSPTATPTETSTASTPGPPPVSTCGSTRKDQTLANTIDPTLAEKLRRESEQTKDDPYPEGARGSRPNRTKVYSVRLSAEEEDQIQRVARSQHLPPSTLVRSWILERLDRERSV